LDEWDKPNSRKRTHKDNGEMSDTSYINFALFVFLGESMMAKSGCVRQF
jgi:hypothetical protein